MRALGSLGEVAPLAAALDALGLASRRPSPFDTFAYLQAFVAHDEYAEPGRRLLFLVAFEADSPVGFLPLRRVPERLHGIPYVAIRCLVSHDNDRPRVVARPADEERCAEAFYRHLFEVERGWDFLELNEQDSESRLLHPPAIPALGRYYLRTFPNNPNATIATPQRTLAEYLHAFPTKHRRKLEKAVRKLVRAGEIELVAARTPESLPAVFDQYLELERRSWKARVDAHIGRHPARVAFFRQLLAPDQAMKLEVHLLLLDGLPIAGAVTAKFAGKVYGLEEAFDEDYRDLAPGNAMMLLLVRDAIESGCGALDLLGNYAYYKARWLATITETRAVQLFRKGSVVHLKALAGEVWRWLRPPVTQRELDFNLARQEAGADAHESGRDEREAVGDDSHEDAARAPRPARRRERERAQVALRAAGATLSRLSGEALRRALPFETGAVKPRHAGGEKRVS